MKLTPTTEQSNILGLASAGHNLAIQARAGAAKTSTCIMVAEELLTPSLYLSFNSDIAKEAGEKFPTHVTCSTWHSLAYRAIVKYPKSQFGLRLKPSLSLEDIGALLREVGVKFINEDAEFDYKLDVRDCIIRYCQSAATSIHAFVSEELYGEDEDRGAVNRLADVAEAYWIKLSNSNSSVTISHDIYLKLYQLSEPVLPYNVIYLDEGQDSNAVTLDIFLKQTHAQKIIVGDKYQAIYEWRGAIDAFESIPSKDFKEATLTESFRYTQDIADIAADMVSILGDKVAVVGRATYKTPQNKAILCRTNSSILGQLYEAYMAGQKVYTNVNLTEVFSRVYHVAALMGGQTPKYPVEELRHYKDFNQLQRAAEKMPEIMTLINLTSKITKLGSVFTVTNNIKSICLPKQQANLVDFSIMTAYKAKGLEWDEVTLADDMIPKLGEEQTLEEWVQENPQEVHLLYISITRAKYKVNIPQEIIDMLENFGM